MKNRFLFICILLGGLLVWGSVVAVEKYIESRAQEKKLAHLDVNALDLPNIINTVDELGGDTQLNWKEIVAIIGIKQENMMYSISDDRLATVANSFLNDSSVLSFAEVVELHFEDEKEIERAHQYLEDLAYIGYVPEKLQPDATEAQFIEKLTDIAKANFEETGILPSITIAQAILESNWGQSDLAVEANNLFGIKADSRWDGTIATFSTTEYSGTVIDAEFRKYEDWYSSIADHAEFLTSNQRYTNAGLFEASTYRDQAQALQDAGYSTATDEYGNLVYAQRLQELIRQYNLQLIDHKVLNTN